MTDLASVHILLDPSQTPEQRLAKWRDVMSLAGEVFVDDPIALEGRFRSRNLGSMRTVEVRSTPYRLVRDSKMARRLPRDHLAINLVEQGRLQGRIAGKAVDIGPGDIILSQTSSTLNLAILDAHWMGLLIPQEIMQSSILGKGRMNAVIYGARTVEGLLIAGLLRALCSLPEALSDRDRTVATDAAASTIKACFGADRTRKYAKQLSKEVSNKEIKEFITKNIRNPEMDARYIASHFSLTRSSLYRIMGESRDIARIIRNIRLRSAALELAAGGKAANLEVVRQAWGFDNARSFRRAFVNAFNLTPSEVRDGKGHPTEIGPIYAEFSDWFTGL